MNKKYKTPSLINLVAGYVLFATFILLVIVNRERLNVVVDEPVVEIVEVNNTIVEEKIVYVPAPGSDLPRVDYVDRLNGVIIDDPDNVYTSVVRGINNTDVENVYDRDWSGRDHHSIVTHGVDHVVDGVRDNVNFRNRDRGVDVVHDDIITYDQARRDDVSIDHGLLDRRLREQELEKDEYGLHTDDLGFDLDKLTVAKDGSEAELGDINMDLNFDSTDTDFGVGKGGQLYAYNYPSQGVGAGIGTGSLGAGNGAGAGLSAGIGEGIASGSTVPTLGGVGTYTKADESKGGGVGGLIGGAGAGGAAGLYTGTVDNMLGVGSGGPGSGGYGRGYNYNHLPKDGALHIMMHVDGSGSILNTRKQLDIMKNTLLKTALLPYYNNDEDLYNRRVTIVSSSGERTLRFFEEAAKKDNVLAIAFQDEAQPAYHLPNFNKKPEDHYLNDLGKLKASLNGYGGLYRGVMFQVDRGKTFAKSFKEFVGNAFHGEGYLANNNLKKYHRDNNTNHIKNKNGIIFSDEYHAKDEGDPQYYLDLIFKASKRVGLDLDIYGAGLKDGKTHSLK